MPRNPVTCDSQAAREFSRFDQNHWFRVKAERTRLGLSCRTAVGEIVDHRLTGRLVTDSRSGSTYRVESVQKDWYEGWFLTALLKQNDSHRLCLIENISCRNDGLLEQIADFAVNFKLTA